MGNYNCVKTEVYNYIRARTPLVIINSSERERAERLLREIAIEAPCKISYYTDFKQVCTLGGSNSQTANVDDDPLRYIASVFKKNRNSTFAFGDVKRIGDDNIYSREILNILYLAKETNSTLILITADIVWSRLAQFGMLTTLNYPDVDERISQLNNFLSAFQGKYKIEWDSENIRHAATLLRGFSEIQIENILSSALASNKGLLKDHLHELTNQKSRLYGAVSSVQEVHINPALEVSGLDNLKRWLLDKKRIFFASDDELNERDLTTPKGILLAGVPGCGKSFSAKMIAKQWELPLFRFDIGTVYDKWVGESEKKMKEALEFINNVSPCVVWIDEIEKALSVADSGNDTGKRVLGQFLFWLQESNSRVFLVATANNITSLPFELFRKGRFSEIFFIDLPNKNEREAAIRLYAKKSLHIEIDKCEMEKLVNLSNGFSYSDIEYSIKDIAQMALSEGQNIVNFNLLSSKFNEIIPISKNNPEMIRQIRQWGKERAVPASTSEEVIK
ncbi:MAG: AAA family ATPase [Oscillospiraceae bacterium]|nr:AAA family ATPase [Oscillospiraceae bacterium]